MAVGVLMPKEGITVESCIMGEWKKQIGDPVRVGEVLFSYETDKAEFECESTAAGTLLARFYEEGDEVPCLVNVCAIGNPGEDTSALKNASPAAEAPAAPAVPETHKAAASAGSCAQAVIMPKEGITVESCIMGEWKKNIGDSVAVGEVLFAYETDKAEFECESTAAGTLLARFYEEGDEVPCLVNVCAIGNVGDAFEHLRPGSEAPAAEKAPAASAPASEAARLEIPPRAMAQMTQQYSFDATQLQAYCELLKELEGPKSRISLNDMVMFAVARTVGSCADLNANMLEDNVVRHFEHVHLGFACDTPRGLIVPTIFNADRKSLLEISMEAKELAAAAREGSLSPEKMSGATFTVINIGSFGCEAFTPVINPPQTGILGVCNIQTRIKSAKDGAITTYPAMGLSLTLDNRAVDSALAARFMQELCGTLENFMTLLAQ